GALLGADEAAGEPLRDPTRWDIVVRLLVAGVPDAPQRLDAQRARDVSPDGRRRTFVAGAAPGRAEVVARLLPYLEAECARGTPLKSMTRHILGLFNGLPGARAWRRHLSEAAHRPGAGPEVVEQALEQLDRRGALLAA
ncbi:MAG: tRNA-dihydrouridine synthase, partial [Tistlia sp.]